MMRAENTPAKLVEAEELSLDLQGMVNRHQREFDDLVRRQRAELGAVVAQVEALLKINDSS